MHLIMKMYPRGQYLMPQVISLFMGQIVSPGVKEVSLAIASLFRRPGNRDNLDLSCLPDRPLSSLSSSLLSASSLMEQRPSIRNSKDLRILPLPLSRLLLWPPRRNFPTRATSCSEWMIKQGKQQNQLVHFGRRRFMGREGPIWLTLFW